jgi:NADPH:quinone reductase-like Zn-dependent oxidoreductase
MQAVQEHRDVWTRSGRPGRESDPAHVPGSDATGVVEATDRHSLDVAVDDALAAARTGPCEVRLRAGVDRATVVPGSQHT